MEKKTLSYEELMAAMSEFHSGMAELKEQTKKTDAFLEKLGRKIDKAHATIVGVSKNNGHHAEQYFQNALDKTKFFGGEKYDKLIRNLKFSGKETCEFDIFLVNGKSVAIIEAKSRIHPDFIEEMVRKKTAQFRKHFPEYKDYKLRLGIAGFSFDDCVIEKAKEHGVGIIRQVGDSIQIDDSELKVY